MKLISMLLAGLLTLIPAGAQAHDSLIDVSPAAGEIVQAGKFELSMGFSAELINLPGSGAEVILTNPSGEVIPTGCPLVEGKQVTLKLDLDAPGEYQAAWRVVSSDGHPINGVTSFSLENTSGYVAGDSEALNPCPEGLIAPAPEENQESATSYWLLWVSLGLVAAGLFFYLRPRRNNSK